MIYARPDLPRRIPEAAAPPVSFLLLLFLSSRALARLARTSSHFPSIAPPFSQQSVPRWPFGLGQMGLVQTLAESFWLRWPLVCITRAMLEPFSWRVCYETSENNR